ncbi:spermidine/putrescine ABC transporter ATP-binding protein [Clostridium botulinum]|uniref:Spermidine/putrescine ABC transporter ATP-binding protein n=1 Tax=Clostridium botulinum (strain Okra / Type B1) TaxID=498213 RepID=B1IH94_CLOBK|nr:hypothetical protein [Clostridium botulinum]EKX81166.1 hypothetical protein CFSAN001628_002277 [Clostridium botulinum CFSAN001628]ACA45981.1 conserved hypothetical protein [Clostridium botulinum B1 str. Okra]MBD5561743.1 spermidine/putrescine ABC transporter ATP-binding protein [Clostridium botulinum]MBD5565409.1 spermidine/putrescine ABC transporter ATP-binding protein [Clostridium botulinum]MBD5570585.1 spermidine/putrescine ABC transporter ATP-binding protein [Clostridium botulinum]
MPCILHHYDRISTYTLELLQNFSKRIMIIENIINELLKDDSLNKNNDLSNFISYFSNGRFYHFRCHGFMECLVVTKSYSPESICYWTMNLVTPASNNFMKALSFIDILKNTHTFETNSQFKNLTMEMDKFKKAAMEIMNAAKLYNINCHNL